MEIKIAKVWGKVRNDRWGVIVVIKNKGNTFLYMPTYPHVKEMLKKLEEVEILNAKLTAKEKKV